MQLVSTGVQLLYWMIQEAEEGVLMRALIRVRVVDDGGTLPPRETREDYDAAIIQLFREIGFSPRLLRLGNEIPDQAALEDSEEVKELFENLQGTIYEEEKRHVVMLGYTSAGQAEFVVCSINPNVLHIRVRDDLFEKLRLACREICAETWNHGDAARRDHLFFWRRPRPYLVLQETIEVMEPGNKTVTILGHIIRDPFRAMLRYNWRKFALGTATLLIAVILFWFSPSLAAPLQQILNIVKFFEVDYLQGALERTYSAFLVTFAVTFIELAMRYADLRRMRPIVWNAGIEPSIGPA